MSSMTPSLFLKRLINVSAVCLALLPLATLQAESIYIEVQSAKLRGQPKAWAAPVADVKYGDEVYVLETLSPWLKVRTLQNVEGFIHSTAITSRKVVLKGTASPTGTIGTFEAVLAGKGFGSEVVDSYAQKRGDVNFELVDTMRRHSTISDEALYTFMKVGGLNVTGVQ